MKLLTTAATALLLLPSAALAAEPAGPRPLPKDAPKLKADKIVMVVGSSVSVRRYRVDRLPKWTGGHNRVPPQCTNGQNVFFRVFEMLNDHENMCWRRLPDPDWKKAPGWRGESRLPWRDASPRISWEATSPDTDARITVPAGYEKIDLIYTSDPNGDAIQVTIDGEAPPENARVETRQDTTLPPKSEWGPVFETLDSHGKPITVGGRPRPIRNIVELRARYALDPATAHTFRIQKASADPKTRILVWGVVYWRGNCVQVVQRAKGGINCGALPQYAAIQEITALKPDYVLMEAINIRGSAAGVTRSLQPGYAWCARQTARGQDTGQQDTRTRPPADGKPRRSGARSTPHPVPGKAFKILVYATPQANCRAFRAWFSDPKHKPPYGGSAKTVADENADACHRAVIDLCAKYGFPLVDVGATVDAWLAKHPTVRFVPHVLNDWYHPNQWGAALFGQTLHDGISTNWPELPLRPITMPAPPAAK